MATSLTVCITPLYIFGYWVSSSAEAWPVSRPVPGNVYVLETYLFYPTELLPSKYLPVGTVQWGCPLFYCLFTYQSSDWASASTHNSTNEINNHCLKKNLMYTSNFAISLCMYSCYRLLLLLIEFVTYQTGTSKWQWKPLPYMTTTGVKSNNGQGCQYLVFPCLQAAVPVGEDIFSSPKKDYCYR